MTTKLYELEETKMNLENLGWNEFFSRHFENYRDPGLAPARVSCERRSDYLVLCKHGALTAELSGRTRHTANSLVELPAVGDWVAMRPRLEEKKATIHAVLPRKSSFSRKAVLSGGMPDTGGRAEEQVLAANIDTVFIVCGLDADFNLRRIERYVAVAWDSGTTPVIVLNKADLCSDVEERMGEVEDVAPGVPVYPVSAVKNEGLEVFQQYLGLGRTAVLLGSSGVGKSTIINSMLGEERLKVRAVREYDGRGRHTTTHREMIFLPAGGIIIDTPGLREIQAWSDARGISRAFEDIEAFAGQCRFRDCRHEREPGCAVRQAIKNGILSAERYRSYVKLRKELDYLTVRKDQRARMDEKKKWKNISIWSRKMKKIDPKRRLR
jgi:ribosome biogenesis GTPase